MRTTTLEAAVAAIPDGASLTIGGFRAVGTHGHATLVETAPGVTVQQVLAATEAELVVPPRVPQMRL